jgi:hypothetical protein
MKMRKAEVFKFGLNQEIKDIEFIFQSHPPDSPLESWIKIMHAIQEYTNNTTSFQIPQNVLKAAKNHMTTQKIPAGAIRHTDDFILADGNCMFRAFAHWKYEDQERHHEVRIATVEYATRHRKTALQLLLSKDCKQLDRWIDKMAKPKVWGDHVVLGLLARRYNVILIVVNYTSSIACGACTQYLPNNPEVVKDVYFFLRKDKHFEIIDPFYHC